MYENADLASFKTPVARLSSLTLVEQVQHFVLLSDDPKGLREH